MNFRPLLICSFMLGAGCAHYGWAANDDLPSLSVSTVTAPPEVGLDEATLTRHLVDSLRKRGMNAAWGAGEVLLQCRADSGDTLAVNDDAAFSLTEMMLTCQISSRPDVTLSRTLDSHATLSSDLSASRRELRLDTAMRAAELIARDVELLLQSER